MQAQGGFFVVPVPVFARCALSLLGLPRENPAPHPSGWVRGSS